MLGKSAKLLGAAFGAAFLLAGCNGTMLPPEDQLTGTTDPVETAEPTVAPAETPPARGTVTLVTTNSFAISDEAKASFEYQSGYTLNVVPIGAAGILANQLVLTRERPLGDAFFGVDNTFASRLLTHDVVTPFRPRNLSNNALTYVLGNEQLTPITQGDVCLNIDLEWFAANGVTPPARLGDLLRPELAGKTVVLNPTTSSPGMAFMLATIAEFGDGEGGSIAPNAQLDETMADGPMHWADYWRNLLANGAVISDSWSQGYTTEFSGAGEGGTHPIVVSYSSSPASTLNADRTETTTAALLDTCFRQIEYAGVLAGANNPTGAEALIEFLSSPEFQSELPTQMWVYPIDDAVALPADWAQFTSQADNPLSIPAELIEENRENWLEQWNQIALQ